MGVRTIVLGISFVLLVLAGIGLTGFGLVVIIGLAYLRFDFAGGLVFVAPGVACLAVAVWLYRQLRHGIATGAERGSDPR